MKLIFLSFKISWSTLATKGTWITGETREEHRDQLSQWIIKLKSCKSDSEFSFITLYLSDNFPPNFCQILGPESVCLGFNKCVLYLPNLAKKCIEIIGYDSFFYVSMQFVLY